MFFGLAFRKYWEMGLMGCLKGSGIRFSIGYTHYFFLLFTMNDEFVGDDVIERTARAKMRGGRVG